MQERGQRVVPSPLLVVEATAQLGQSGGARVAWLLEGSHGAVRDADAVVPADVSNAHGWFSARCHAMPAAIMAQTCHPCPMPHTCHGKPKHQPVYCTVVFTHIQLAPHAGHSARPLLQPHAVLPTSPPHPPCQALTRTAEWVHFKPRLLGKEVGKSANCGNFVWSSNKCSLLSSVLPTIYSLPCTFTVKN